MSRSGARTALRTRARRGEGDRLREEILDAAERLLHEAGDHDAVSIRMITDAVGCTAPSIYRHFDDKATLMYAVCQRLFDQLQAAFEEGSGAIEDPLETLRALGHAYLDFGLENPEAYRIMFLTRASGEPGGPAPRTLSEAAVADSSFATLTRAVGAAMDAGHIRPEDPLAVAVDLWTMVHGVTSLAVVGNRYFPYPDPHAELERLMELALAGYTP